MEGDRPVICSLEFGIILYWKKNIRGTKKKGVGVLRGSSSVSDLYLGVSWKDGST